MERAQLRIVAGTHRGRKLNVGVHPGMRPTPQMVREALFSILGNAVPGRPFYDIFAGTGVNGLEALSRKASRAIFLERDFKLAGAIEKNLKQLELADRGQVLRSDVYRWAERWMTPSEPVNLFVSPPFPDLTDRADDFLHLVNTLRERMGGESVLSLQLEVGFPLESLPDVETWDIRHYGRNILAISA